MVCICQFLNLYTFIIFCFFFGWSLFSVNFFFFLVSFDVFWFVFVTSLFFTLLFSVSSLVLLFLLPVVSLFCSLYCFVCISCYFVFIIWFCRFIYSSLIPSFLLVYIISLLLSFSSFLISMSSIIFSSSHTPLILLLLHLTHTFPAFHKLQGQHHMTPLWLHFILQSLPWLLSQHYCTCFHSHRRQWHLATLHALLNIVIKLCRFSWVFLN